MTILFRRLALVAALALPAGLAFAAPQGGAPDGAPAATLGGAPTTDRIDAPAQPGATTTPQTYRGRHELRERAEHRSEAGRGDAGRSEMGRNEMGRNEMGRNEIGRNEPRHEYRHASRNGDANAAMRSGDRTRHD